MLKACNKKKEEMVGTRTYYFRRCKNSVIDCVPDEVLYEILLRVPAQDIISAMLVCRKWYQMVCSSSKIFIRKHFEHSSYGLLYQNKSYEVFFTYARKVGGGIDTIKLNYSLIAGYCLWSSCNGLVLEYGRNIHYVRNVLSHQLFRLPQSPYDAACFLHCVIGYDAASMKYKVVLPFKKTQPYTFGILTLGVDKSWRILSTGTVSDLVKNKIIYVRAIVTEGFVHWRCLSRNTIVTLNLETEIFVEAPTPVTLVGCCLLSSGRYLTLFSPCEKFVWNVLEMKPETGEWKKLPDFRFEGVGGKIIALGWLKYRELLALRFQEDRIIFYDFITCEFRAETLPISRSYFRVTLHKNSLVRVGEF